MTELVINRRRHERIPVELFAQVTGVGGDGLIVQVLNLSRVGALLVGDRQLKTRLYRRKNQYTHRPVNSRFEFLVPIFSPPLLVDGSGVYLRQLADEEIQIGFKFFQEISQQQLEGLLECSGQDWCREEYRENLAQTGK